MPAGSKMDLPLAKAKPISNGGASNTNGYHKKHVFDSAFIRPIQVTWIAKRCIVTQNTSLDNRKKSCDISDHLVIKLQASIQFLLDNYRGSGFTVTNEWFSQHQGKRQQEGVFSSENIFYSNIISTARGMA
ncbi:hypothetical protein GRJ2_000600500 [Grus japonensis]|uniref:Uncharacterized protein n=1 Tax=Grus japonensis TaxID=30415 RepID=A0ABC9W8L6_GRUJA